MGAIPAKGDRVTYTVMYNDGRGMGEAHIEHRPAFGRVTRVLPQSGPRQEPKVTIAVEDPQPGSARYVERYASDVSVVWAPTDAEKLAGAEAERHQLIENENARHVSNARSELKRYEEALAHIERVFLLRTGQAESLQEARVSGS
jgi:hypothetical protein